MLLLEGGGSCIGGGFNGSCVVGVCFVETLLVSGGGGGGVVVLEGGVGGGGSFEEGEECFVVRAVIRV